MHTQTGMHGYLTGLHMGSSNSIRLLQFTDMHLQGHRHATLRGVNSFDNLLAARRHAAHHFANAQGILLTGDLVHDDAAGYALLREAFHDSTVPVHCIPGNHDVPAALRQELARAPFDLSTHVVYGNWLIVLLDSWLEGNAAGRLGDMQLAQLEKLLHAYPQHHTLLCLHHHPIEMQSEWLDAVGLQDATALRECIGRHPQVRGVLWGHVHQALDDLRQGVHYMATPATCAQFLPKSRHFAVDDRPAAYRTLELHSDGRIDTQVHWLSEEY